MEDLICLLATVRTLNGPAGLITMHWSPVRIAQAIWFWTNFELTNACKMAGGGTPNQARSQGGAGGAMAPPKSAKRSTSGHKVGQKWGFCRRVYKGGEVQKSPLFGSKRSTFWGSRTPQNQSWLQACSQWKVVWRLCHPKGPPFQTIIFLAPETHHFKLLSTSRDPTSIFWKISICNLSPIFVILAKFQLNDETQKCVPETKKSVPETLGDTYLGQFSVSW